MSKNYLLNQSVKKIFTIILLLPIIIQLVLINMVQSVSDERVYYFIFAIFALLYLPYFYWLNIVVQFLINHPNKYFNLKLTNFKVSLILNIIVMFNFIFFVAYSFNLVFKGGEPSNEIFLFVGLIQFIGVLSFSYTSYFISKLILTIELKRNVYFNEIISNLVVFSFPPIALWSIHNKIKQIQSLN